MPQNSNKDLACQLSNALEDWSTQDANTAFDSALGSFTAKNSAGQLAVRAVKGLSGVTELFGTASVVEGVGAGLINGYKSGDYSGAFLDTASDLMSRAAGLKGFPSQAASKASDQIIKTAKSKSPC